MSTKVHKSKWDSDLLSDQHFVKEPSKSTTTAQSKWNDDVTHGGIIWNASAHQYNMCFPLAPNGKFNLQKGHIKSGEKHAHIKAAFEHRYALGELQLAVGRLAFHELQGGFLSYNVPVAFFSGFFISPTRFITCSCGLKDAYSIMVAKHAEHKICPEGFAPVSSLEDFPDQWYSARLVDANLAENFAVYELITTEPSPVKKFIPLSEYCHEPITVGECVVAIVFNSSYTKAEINLHFDNLPDEEKPAEELKLNEAAVVYYMATDYKSLSPGYIVSVGDPCSPALDDLFHVSCSFVKGSSGAPIFRLTANKPPQLIGLILGGRPLHNCNYATRLTFGMLQMAACI